MNKEIQSHAYRAQAKETANAAGSFSKRFVDKAVDMLRDRHSIEQALRVQVSRLQIEAQNTAVMALELFDK